MTGGVTKVLARMNHKKFASVFAVFVGISMIGMWFVFYFTGNIPELETKPVEIGAHILAEMATAVLLIIGGIWLSSGKKRGREIFLLAMGMLLYTLIMSPAYFLQSGEYGFVVMFAVLTALAVLVTVTMVGQESAP